MTEPAPPVFAEAAPAPQGKMQFEYADDLPDPGADKTMMGISVRYVPDDPRLNERVHDSGPQKPVFAGGRAHAPHPA